MKCKMGEGTLGVLSLSVRGKGGLVYQIPRLPGIFYFFFNVSSF